MVKNWFGIEEHWTDDLIHWSDKDTEGTAKKLREAADKIEAAGLKGELKFLLEKSYRHGCQDIHEDNAGAAL